MERIISKVKELYCLDDNCIISIEAHIRDLQSAEYVRALQAIGVNRVSFGIQSCSESLRKTYGLMPLSYVYNAVDILRAVGIYDYNSDIMYGFPEQKCKYIVAINHDEDAPIFKYADLCIKSDSDVFTERLFNKLMEARC